MEIFWKDTIIYLMSRLHRGWSPNPPSQGLMNKSVRQYKIIVLLCMNEYKEYKES